MSPEQVRGAPVDHRTDIFSFGVVLYEMVAGFPPFRRTASGETLTAILYEEPPSLPPGSEAHRIFGAVIARCLQKTPDERYRSVHDLARDLEAAQEEAARPAPQPRSRRPLFIAAGVVAVV